MVHRKQASVYELAKQLPSAAGLLIEAELHVLERLTVNPEKPYTVVLGGSKVSDKLDVIGALLPRVNRLLVGGGMLFTFLVAQGHKVGASLLELDQVETVKGYLEKAADLGVEIVLPTDVVVAEKFGGDARHVVAASDAIEDTEFGAAGLGLDIGPETSAALRLDHRELEDGVLERTDGRLRVAAIRGGHVRDRRGPHQGRRPRGRRRGRLRGRRARTRIL